MTFVYSAVFANRLQVGHLVLPCAHLLCPAIPVVQPALDQVAIIQGTQTRGARAHLCAGYVHITPVRVVVRPGVQHE